MAPKESVPLAKILRLTNIVSPSFKGGFSSFDKPLDKFILIFFRVIVPFLLTLINSTFPLEERQYFGPPGE